ncbi:MAG TPA: hypothetical protein VMC85_01525 [Desulfomonilaceae bacterium]|nr:hypothetical protein [Desulfomonilaceae bacterium]
MDDWSEFLAREASFHRILKSLCKENCETLNNDIPVGDPQYQYLLKCKDVKNLADLDRKRILAPVDGFVLICIYAWVRVVKIFTSPEDLAPLFLVFARYLMPAYYFHIFCNPTTREKIKSCKEAKEWILSIYFNYALSELEITFSAGDLENGLKELKEYNPNDSLSRQLMHGSKLLYGEVCSLLGIKPIYEIKEKHIHQGKNVEAYQEKAEVPLHWNPPLEQIDTSEILRSSPILRGYWGSDEFARAFTLLWERDHQLPKIRHVVIQMVWEALDKTTLNNNQRLLALELLKDLPNWGLRQKPPQLSVSYQDATLNGNQYLYKSELSLLLDQLLSSGLLMVDGMKIKITQPVINDFALTLGHLKTYGARIFLPQGSELDFSQWVFWMMDHLIDDNRLDEASLFLYRIQGAFPGYCSHSWRELANVLGLLPDHAFREPLIWTILTVALAALKNQCPPRENDFKKVLINLHSRLPVSPSSEIPSGVLEDVSNFQDAIKKYLALIDTTKTPDNPINYQGLFNLILKKPVKALRENIWIKVNFLSDLRHLDIDEFKLVLGPSTKSLNDFMKQAKKYDEISQLAVAELFAASMETMVIDDILDHMESGYMLPQEVITRLNIIKKGIQFPHEYGNWI